MSVLQEVKSMNPTNETAGMERIKTARAFAPGHLTAFFRTADDSDNPWERGSLGSGICLSKGAFSSVSVKRVPYHNHVSERSTSPSSMNIRVLLDGEPSEAPVTTFAVRKMLDEARSRGYLPESLSRELEITVETELQLPQQSGWGMSGAGALSTVLALGKALSLPFSYHETAFFAHLAELTNSSGLGDVAAQCTGGLTIRKRPGIPPHGFIDTIKVPPVKVVCLTLTEEMSTSSILNDPQKRKVIDKEGQRAVDSIIREPTLERFLNLSREFTIRSGLASPEILEALEAVHSSDTSEIFGDQPLPSSHEQSSSIPHRPNTASHVLSGAGMAMLGNSLFAIGDTDTLVDILSPFGRVDVCTIDPAGARLVLDEVKIR